MDPTGVGVARNKPRGTGISCSTDFLWLLLIFNATKCVLEEGFFSLMHLKKTSVTLQCNSTSITIVIQTPGLFCVQGGSCNGLQEVGCLCSSSGQCKSILSSTAAPVFLADGSLSLAPARALSPLQTLLPEDTTALRKVQKVFFCNAVEEL